MVLRPLTINGDSILGPGRNCFIVTDTYAVVVFFSLKIEILYQFSMDVQKIVMRDKIMGSLVRLTGFKS
jgi:hypothetical protein